MSATSSGSTIVVGASRGLGRGIATAFADAGAHVVAVARTTSALDELDNAAGTLRSEVADASDATVAGSLLDRYDPEPALAGSPLSGGYAGAKATQRFITQYAQEEANRADLGITFSAVLPRITPLTDLGGAAVRAYAARGGQSEEEYLQQFGELLTPEVAGAALLELARADAATVAPGYLLTGAGLQKLP
jgi:NAD(P)-dependent dehydrogenase (short-subunit alcohol dehydrogenase family)